MKQTVLRGLASIIAFFLISLVVRLVKKPLLPFTKIFRLGAGQRNLRAEVEAAYPRLVIPDQYVEYHRPRLSSIIKNRWRQPFQQGRGRALSPKEMPAPPPPHNLVDESGRIMRRRLNWRAAMRSPFHLPHLPLPRRGSGIIRIKPLPADLTPVVAIVNSKSGGKQGKNLLKRLRAALSPAQVFDIRKTDIRDALRLYSNVTNPITLLVCGGDGTASKIFELADEIQWRTPPRLAVLPLGTGNDIARVLDWGQHVMDWSGGVFSGDADEAMMAVLGDVDRALERRIDRWEVLVTPGTAVPSLDRHKQPVRFMLAYLGVGVDGKVALDFHRLRERFPALFIAPWLNRLFYGVMALRELVLRSCKNLPDKVELWADGRLIQLPPLTESFIILNINSHAGGVALWPEDGLKDVIMDDEDETTIRKQGLTGQQQQQQPQGPAPAAGEQQQQQPFFRPSRYDDGLLEVVAATGVLHLGRIRVGLDRPVRLVQAREIRIRTKSFLPGQVDGEPWKLPRCELTIRHCGQAPVLQHVSRELVRYHDWLVERGELNPTTSGRLVDAFKAQQQQQTTK